MNQLITAVGKRGGPMPVPRRPRLGENYTIRTSGREAFARLFAVVGELCKTRGRKNLFATTDFCVATAEVGHRYPKLESLFTGESRNAEKLRKTGVSGIPESDIEQLNEAQGLINAFRTDKGKALLAEAVGRDMVEPVSNSLTAMMYTLDAYVCEIMIGEDPEGAKGAPQSLQ